MGPDAESTYPPTSPEPSTKRFAGRRRLLSEVLPSSTTMTGTVLGLQLDPVGAERLFDELSSTGALVSARCTSATFRLDREYVTGSRPYVQVAASTNLALAALAAEGLLVEVNLYRGCREIFRGRFEEHRPGDDLVNLVDCPASRWAARGAVLARAVRAASRWLYTGLQLSGVGYGLTQAAHAADDPSDHGEAGR
jgi:hypothetical protein